MVHKRPEGELVRNPLFMGSTEDLRQVRAILTTLYYCAMANHSIVCALDRRSAGTGVVSL